MIYINGLGYVEEPTTIAVPTTTDKYADLNFADILNSKTIELSGKSYTLDEIFQEAADTFGLDKNFLAAVGYRESGFNPNDTSSSGAMGIMQLMPGTAAYLGVTNAYDAYENIMGGAKYLKELYDKYSGVIDLVLAAYNMGPGTVDRAGGVPDSSGVRRYISDIKELMQKGVDIPDKVFSSGTTSNAPLVLPSSSTEANVAIPILSNNIVNPSTLKNKTTNTSSADKATNTVTVDNKAPDAKVVEKRKLTQNERDAIQNVLTNQYYKNMLSIISGMGGDSNSDEGDSLSDLYRLGMVQDSGLKDLTSIVSRNDAIIKAAQAYAAGSSLLD